MAVVVWLTVENVPVQAFGIWPRVLVLALLAIFTVASLASTEVIPWTSRSWIEWRKPKVLGNLVFLLLSAVGFIAGIANVFDPPATEATQMAIRKDVGEIAKDTDALAAELGIGRPSRVRQAIAGVWGEPGCAVTYRFVLKDRSLALISLEGAPGMKPLREDYTIVTDADRAGAGGEHISIMEATEVGGPHDGQAVTFTLGDNGATPWLEWKHRNREINAPRFVPCPVRAAR